jgi:hypothetical protein
MGRPAIVTFESFTDTVALEGAKSILKTEKATTVAAVADRFRKRVKVEAKDEALFVARVRASLDTLASEGKVKIDGENVTVVAGKRGRPRKTPAVDATASA